MTQTNHQPMGLLTENDTTPHQIPTSNNAVEQKLDVLSDRMNRMWRMDGGLLRSLHLFHWIGYGLLVLFLFDLVELLYPPGFMNPAWEFQFIGQMVERSPVPLLGFGLIFLGEKTLRAAWERPFVKVLSWLTLVISVVFFLMVPLGIVDTVRLTRLNQTQIQAQVEEMTGQIAAASEQLEQVTTPAELEALINSLAQEADVTIADAQAMETTREELAQSLENGARQVQTQAQASLRSQHKQLIRNSVKWNLGAMVIAALFFTMWKGTRWARVR